MSLVCRLLVSPNTAIHLHASSRPSSDALAAIAGLRALEFDLDQGLNQVDPRLVSWRVCSEQPALRETGASNPTSKIAAPWASKLNALGAGADGSAGLAELVGFAQPGRARVIEEPFLKC